MKEKKNVYPLIKGGGKPSPQKIDLQALMKDMKENFDFYLEKARMEAKAKRTFYRVCIAEGFSKEEALKLAADYKVFGA